MYKKGTHDRKAEFTVSAHVVACKTCMGVCNLAKYTLPINDRKNLNLSPKLVIMCQSMSYSVYSTPFKYNVLSCQSVVSAMEIIIIFYAFPGTPTRFRY